MISLFKEVDVHFIAALKRHVDTRLAWSAWYSQVQSVLQLHRYQSGAPIEVLFGELQAQQNVTENGLTFRLDLGQKQNNGLYLDMRYGRKWVLENSRNKRVLNLFAYTCGFSVAAIAGEATSVVNLDMAKAALSKGRQNHQVNEHDLAAVSFLGHDLFKSWEKVKKYGPYDLIIIDPPSFKKGSFALTKDYKKILRRLHELLAEYAPQMTFEKRLDNPPEFVDADPEASLKSLLFSTS